MKNNSITLLWILSAISAIVLLVLMSAYEKETQISVNNILFILSIIFVCYWIFRIGVGIIGIIIGIFLSPFETSNNYKPTRNKKKKKRKKIKDKEELNFFQFIIFYPILTFGMVILFGMAMSGFKP